MTQNNIEGQMTIFDFLPDIPKKHSMVYFKTGNRILRGIVVENDKPGTITVSSEHNIKYTLSEWYKTRQEANEAAAY